ncbi:hypothetical protein D3C75_324280 [compost metagenome]
MASANLSANQRRVAVERVVHYTIAACQRQEVRIVADQSACRDQELQTHLSGSGVDHVDHFRLAGSQTFHYGAHAFFRNVNQQTFQRFHFDAVDFFYDNLWLGYLHFVAFTAHILNQNPEVKLTASGYDKGIRAVSFIYAQADIRFKLFEQTLAKFTGSYPFTFFTCERAVVHEEGHLHSRLIDLQNRQCFRVSRIGNRFTDVDVLDTGNRNDITCAGFFGFNTLQALEAKQLLNTGSLTLAVTHNYRYGLALLNHAAVNTSNSNTSQIFIVIHQGYEELQRLVNFFGW